jgi:hypothetical protein
MLAWSRGGFTLIICVVDRAELPSVSQQRHRYQAPLTGAPPPGLG